MRTFLTSIALLLLTACWMFAAGDAPARFHRDLGILKTPWGEKHCFDTMSASKMVPPMYPFEEKNNRITGEALVLVLVSTKGKVTDVSVLQSSGNDALDRAAREALRKWRYEPLIEDGVAREFVSIQRMNFTLTEKEE